MVIRLLRKRNFFNIFVLVEFMMMVAWSTSGFGKEVKLAADLEQVALREDFNSIEAWEARMAWLSNASATAKVTAENGIACFSVDEPGKGMKWVRKITPEVVLSEMRYLVVRYRAENAKTTGFDYFVYLDSGGKKQCNAMLPEDVVSDGQWHIIAVDTLRIAAEPNAKVVAIQVQATEKGKANLWVDWLIFSQELPEGANELRAVQKISPEPDWTVPLATATWAPQKGWLSNPCQNPETYQEDNKTIWRVTESERGMKWLCSLPERVKPAGYRFLSLHYRATNYKPVSDYMLSVIGNPKGDGRDYIPVISPKEIVSDGRWHTLTADITSAAAQFEEIGALAVQVQASAQVPAELHIDRLILTNQRAPLAISEFLNLSQGANFNGFLPVDFSGLCNLDLAKITKRLNIENWIIRDAVTVQGIPFKIMSRKPDLYCTSFDGQEELNIPVKAKANEVYIFLWGLFLGDEEPVRGAGRLERIADVDRFRVRLEYSDGSWTECLPVNIATRRFEISRGPQVLCAFAESTKELSKITLRDITNQGVFGISAITCRIASAASTSSTGLFSEFKEDAPLFQVKKCPSTPPSQAPDMNIKQNNLVISNTHLKMTLEHKPLPRIIGLINQTTVHDYFAGRGVEPLLQLILNGKPVDLEVLKISGEPKIVKSSERVRAELQYEITTVPGLILIVQIEAGSGTEIFFDIAFKNNGEQSAQLGFAGPNLGNFCLGKELNQNYYLFPKAGASFHNLFTDYRLRYCGTEFPLQFLCVVNPDADEGLYLRTEGREAIWRFYCLRKTEKGVFVGMDYPAELLNPGAVRYGVRTIFGVTGGDWHEGFEAYRKWLQTWYKPFSPRKQWFREVFNFRQRFLWAHDPLYDKNTGEFHLERAIEEAKEKFGGIEYLHIFDWGNCGPYGRIYGRTGDYSPYDYLKGGKDAFKQAIAGVQAQGVHVGLYIEGYLLQEKGKLGQTYGKDWQIVKADGRRIYWPDSTEMFICPWVPAWREVQASTYASKVSELNVDGMYMDQFGFANSGKDCYSKEHGHPVPGYTVLGEQGCTQLVRERIDSVKSDVALYSEESPCDINSQYQDGSFTYSMASWRRISTLVPLNMLRFAIPGFKTFEILVCDKPTGTWATGVKWVFFNGEGIWLEGPADEWFSPDTLATIKKCHAILREHKDAFTSSEPVPLVSTESANIFANFFPANNKIVYTLYNARHRTFTGEVLRLKRIPGARYFDAWNERILEPRRDGEFDILSTTIEPQGVGCIIIERKSD